jgi:uncharacterized protein (TIGR03435 family)
MMRVVAGLLLISASAAPGAAQGTSFDVASIHVNDSGTTQTNIKFTPGSVTFTNLTLRAIIQFAYGINQPSRLAGVPDWANSERFDIVARGDVASLEDRRVKLQALLADRFKLAAHTEQRSLPIYTLVLAGKDGKLGPSMKTSAVDCTAQRCGARPGGPGDINLTGVQMSAFAAMLSITQGRTVVDATALTGSYDIHLMFAPDAPVGRADAPPVPEGRPSIFAALQEQLGLKLQPGNRPEDVLVVDRVSRPDEN